MLVRRLVSALLSPVLAVDTSLISLLPKPSHFAEVQHRGENGASTKERMDAATWLADRGFGKPTVNSGSQAPGIGDFTITIGEPVEQIDELL